MEAKKVNLLAVAIFAVFTGLLFWKLDGELRGTTAELDRVRAELRRFETLEDKCQAEVERILDDQAQVDAESINAWDDMDEAYDELLECEEGQPTGMTDCTECWDIYSWSEAYEEEPPC